MSLYWWVTHLWGRRHKDCGEERWDCALFDRWLGNPTD